MLLPDRRFADDSRTADVAYCRAGGGGGCGSLAGNEACGTEGPASSEGSSSGSGVEVGIGIEVGDEKGPSGDAGEPSWSSSSAVGTEMLGAGRFEEAVIGCGLFGYLE